MTFAVPVRGLSLLALLACVQLPIGCATAAKAPAAPKAPTVASGVPEVATLLTGSFSSEAQSKVDGEFFDVRLHMTPIWTSRADGPWLYVEQAMATNLDRPYRQRVYRLIDRGDGSVESFVYELPNQAERVGAWSDPSRFDADSPDALVPRAGCSIVLQRVGTMWVGSTNERDCESSLRGASYATSEVILRANGLESWDRGFDANDNQVWGAKKGPYEFRRIR
ncbi:MAG: phycocyanobilin lyase CpcT [Planctomycetota bacterium]|jgi:CpeT protein